MGETIQSNIVIHTSVHANAGQFKSVERMFQRMLSVIQGVNTSRVRIEITATGMDKAIRDVEELRVQMRDLTLETLSFKDAIETIPDSTLKLLSDINPDLAKRISKPPQQETGIEISKDSGIRTGTETATTTTTFGDETDNVKRTITAREIQGTTEKQVKNVRDITDGANQLVSTTEREIDHKERILFNEEKRVRLQKIKNELLRKEVEENKRLADIAVKRLEKQGFTEGPSRTKSLTGLGSTGPDDLKVNFRTLTKPLNEIQDRIITIDERSGTITKSTITNNERLREQRKIQAEIAKQKEDQLRRDKAAVNLTEARNRSLQEGFTALPVTKVTDSINGITTEHQKFFKVAKKGFAQYEVTLRTVNGETGRMKDEIIRGAQAARFLGDSFGRAGEKVLIWTVATTAMFGTLRLIRQISEEIKELEANTIFLARVGSQTLGPSFEERLKQANLLTDQIVELSAATGTSAIEAQRAAAVFLRAGQDREQVIESVKASLLASRIAELEVEEAATLLSAALLQFNLEAKDLLPTLDSLNTLSNNYRVTTKDLLESISRAGSVIAQHEGRLSELSAATAVVSQTTARTGSQIGNAFKTIQSRLDRFEVRESLFDKIGLSAERLDGQSKSLTETLLELQTRLDGLSAAEQKELTIQIAGIRQRNILIAAIEKADKAIIAETKSLLESGSASGEFQETVGTLESALKRLQSTLTQISESARGPVGTLAKNILNIANFLLKMINAFDGRILNAAALVGFFVILKRGLIQLTVAVGNLSNTLLGSRNVLVGLSNVVRSYTVNVNAATVSTRNFNLQLAGTATSAARSKAILRSLFSTANLWTAAVIAGSFAISKHVEASANYQNSLQSEREGINASISASEKRVTAINNATNAIIRLILQSEKLRELGNGEQALTVDSRARGIAGAAGIDLSQGNLGRADIRDAIAQAREKERMETEKTKESLDRLVQIKRQEVAVSEEAAEKARKEFEAARDLQEIREDSFIQRFIPRGSDISDGIASLTEGNFDRQDIVDKRLRRLAAAQAAAEQELENKRSELESQEKRKDSIKLLDPEALARRNRAKETNEILIAQVQLNAENQKQLDISRRIAGASGIKELTEDYRRATELSNKLSENLKELSKTEDPRILANDQEKLNQLVDTRLKLYEQITKEIQKQRTEFFSGEITRRDNLQDFVDQNRLSAVQGFRGTNKNIARIQSIDLSRQNIVDRIDKRSEDIKSITDPARLQAEKKKQEEDLLKLRDLEVDKVKAILDAEKNIALERKKSADEAIRALGALSEEDKLRVRAQAAFFAANPDKKISVEEQLLGDAGSNRILQQFFGSKADTSIPTSTPFGKSLRDSGFGTTSEIDKASAEIRRIRGGLTTDELTRDALGRASKLDEQAGLTAGRAVGGLSGSTGNQLDLAESAESKVDLDVSFDTFDLSRITEAFEDIVNVQIADKVAEQFEFIRDNIIAARQTGVPGRINRS